MTATTDWPIVSTLEDLRRLKPATLTPNRRKQLLDSVAVTMAQSVACHPGWTLNEHVAYLVSDEFMDVHELAAILSELTHDVWRSAVRAGTLSRARAGL